MKVRKRRAPKSKNNTANKMPNASESIDDVKSELPIARIRIIMKSSADPSVPLIKLETLHLVSKATEMFIKKLAKESFNNGKGLEYGHIADYVQSDNNLEFLHSTIPKKITGKTFLKLLKEADDSDKSDNSEESDSSSSSSSSDESSSDESGSNENEEVEEKEDDKNKKK